MYVYWYWIYSGIKYILPTYGGYVLIWIYSANNRGNILILEIFCQQLADIFWYWIYFANNWGIYSDIGYFLPAIGGYNLVLDIFCQQLGHICQLIWGVCAPLGRRVADCAFTRMCIFFLKSIFCNPTPSN